ncbi:MAG: beta-ketoacyl-[acyl-carrier-protein] synthase family protein [Spirochaetes bacterium]|nr:MAG: beta-ketoacyl-[acyl-carrier-protein] synthase family protein [Spirochaetota bacterium]
MKRRVVITGMGTINPLGDDLDTYYKNLMDGKSGIKVWESLDLTNIECKIGGDLGDYDWNGKLENFKSYFTDGQFKKIKKLFRTTTFSARLSILCTMDAYRDAGLLGKDVDPDRTSVIVAGHNLNSNYIFRNGKQFMEEPEFIDPLCGVEAIDPNVPALITEVLKLEGPTFTIGGACASGNLALREGMRDIQWGECERSIITGALFDVSAADIQASVIINAVVAKPEYQSEPEKASRPFDQARCGFVYSHGTGTLILEELDSALKRNARIYGEVLGVSANSNACHLPQPGAAKQAKVMRELFRVTGLKPEDVDYVNCHATGTKVGDIQEIRAIKETFGDHAYKIKLNAPKSMLGHTCWASPIVETIGGLLQMKYGKLHPTTNIDNLDPEVDLDICPNRVTEHGINLMLKNSFGFGGINCCSLIRRYEG